MVLLNCVSEQPEKPKSYVRILFADPSSAFTLPRPISLPERSWTYNNLSRAITLWIVSFLTERKKRARVCTDDAISPSRLFRRLKIGRFSSSLAELFLAPPIAALLVESRSVPAVVSTSRLLLIFNLWAAECTRCFLYFK